MGEMKVNLLLDQSETALLLKMCEDDYRHPREQMHYLLREEAKRRGLIQSQPLKKIECDTGKVEALG